MLSDVRTQKSTKAKYITCMNKGLGFNFFLFSKYTSSLFCQHLLTAAVNVLHVLPWGCSSPLREEVFARSDTRFADSCLHTKSWPALPTVLLSCGLMKYRRINRDAVLLKATTSEIWQAAVHYTTNHRVIMSKYIVYGKQLPKSKYSQHL